MSHWWVIRVWAGCGAIVLLGACGPRERPTAVPVTDYWESGPQQEPSATVEAPPASPDLATTQPSGEASPVARPEDQVIATVNGTAIERSRLIDMLIASHGLRALEQLILLTAVRQRATQMGLTVSDADIKAAHDAALNSLATPVTDPNAPHLSREQAERLLDGFLTAKNISRGEWDCRMEQRAYLDKIAAAEIQQTEITEKMLREEYNLSYGEKVQIRHIQLSTLEGVRRARELLASGKDFELVARQVSENDFTAAEGGLVRPFTRDDPGVTPALREAAFALQVGQISEPIREQETYHIIKLERRFPASGVGFENVDHQALKRKLLDRLAAQRRQALEQELFQGARVDIRHPELRRQFNQKYYR